MRIVCINQFGDCKPGDERVIPDGAAFSDLYFREVPEEPAEEEAAPELPEPQAAPKGRRTTKKDEG